jgi:hypothetical protein
MVMQGKLPIDPYEAWTVWRMKRFLPYYIIVVFLAQFIYYLGKIYINHQVSL